MKLTIMMICITVLSATAGSYAQQINLSEKNATLTKVLDLISEQTDYDFIVVKELNKLALPVTLNVKDATIEEVMTMIFNSQPLSYSINDKSITITKKERSFIEKVADYFTAKDVNGRVVDSLGSPLIGASIKVKNTNKVTSTDRNGNFFFSQLDENAMLQISYIGYVSKEISVKENLGAIVLSKASSNLEAVEVVVNTGYYEMPKERATGAFTVVNQELFNRTTGTNVLERLEGITSGVQFLAPGTNDPKNVRVRGVSSLYSNTRPLIVVDNFPYEGNYTSRSGADSDKDIDLSFLNPNDIESVTILKDAAAASIWGARASNGVIVITTKKGRYNQKARVSFNANTTISDKPDLLYNRSRLPSETVMAIEKEKYDLGGYYSETAADQAVLPEYVELLIKYKNDWTNPLFLAQETIMKNTEVREEAMKHLYQPKLNQQYAFNASGGGQAHSYYLSMGYDKNREMLIGNDNDRLNLNLQNTFKLAPGLEVTAGVVYSQASNRENGLGLSSLGAGNFGVSPYIRLADEQGNPLSIIKDLRQPYKDQQHLSEGLLDWNYRPLDEINLNDISGKSKELKLNASVKYSFLNYFSVDARYQKTNGDNSLLTNYVKDGYYIRHWVNKFTDKDGKRALPYGAMQVARRGDHTSSNTGRIQVNYNQDFGSDHSINALAGSEIYEIVRTNTPGYTLYNYNKDILSGESNYDYTKRHPVRPVLTQTQLLPSSFPINLDEFTDRFLSHFANASYSYLNRYTVSGSARWDGSNLYGVKSNQKGTPLWSLGANWTISEEEFFKRELVSYLRLRATYGSSGNTNQNVSHFPTIRYNAGRENDLNQGTILSAGNPSLRWERVSTLNTAIDFASKNDRISGSFDYYVKDAEDLIGQDLLAPSTGIITGGTATSTGMVNYAKIRTKGFDFQLKTRNVMVGDFQWNSIALLNYVTNKITNVYINPVTAIYNFTGSSVSPVVGMSPDVLYATPWYGLDPKTGYPLMYIDGEITTNYALFQNSLNREMLSNAGVTVPTFFGSLRNEFSYKNISVSGLISWKSNYKFRRASHFSGSEYNRSYHMDYFKRWEKPGDELTTHVPAHSMTIDTYGSSLYNSSEVLVTKGDHIRLQDVAISYTITGQQMKLPGIQSVRLYANARNLGILWRANKFDIDPDYANAEYRAPKTYAFGIQVGF